MVQKWGGIRRISWWNYWKNGQLLQAMATHTRIVRTIQKKRLPKSIRQSFFVVLVPLKVRRG